MVIHYSIIGLIFVFISQVHGISVKILSEQELVHFSVIESQTNHTGTDAYIRKVTDDNRVYILKQIRNSSIDEQFLLINDCIASSIGYELGVPINEVFFVPYNAGSHLKKYPERAATLHCIVPGQDLESAFPTTLPIDFSLHQKVINHNSPWQKKYPLLDTQQGLSQLVIESMGMHDDLCAIAALDCFVGNSDRSNPNLFYDAKNNSFYGIDQAAAFSKRLPLLACDRINELLCCGYFEQCSMETLDSLRHYRTILRKLYEEVTLSIIVECMQNLTPYLAYKAPQHHQIIARIEHHREIIICNYLHTKELLKLLNQILR